MQATLRAHGRRDAEDVWNRYARPARWSEWSPQIRSVESSDERLRVGTTGRVHPVVGPAVQFLVTAYDEGSRSWSWEVRLGPARLILDHTVSATPDGSATTLEVHGPALLVAPYLPLAQLAINRLVR